MERSRFEQVLQQIAQANHTTVEDVRREMTLAMMEGQRSNDPLSRAKWAAIPKKGEELTLEEFVAYLVQEMKRQQGER